jgi:pimeloyl-ACP methyl ester carboxylesterase
MLPELKSAADLSYRESGPREAPALVLLHGIGSTSAAWRLQYGSLGGVFRVIGWDAPGYGASRPLPGEAPPADAYARALAALLDAIGVESAILGTNSWGTATGIAFARLYPRRTRALALGGPANGFAGLAPEERAKRIAERVERISTLGPKAMREQDAGRLLAPGARPELLDWVRSPEGVTVEGYCQAARMMGSVDCARDIATVSCPVIVVSGEKDIVTPPEQNAKRIAAAAPRATLVMVPDCGHLPHLEAPEAFNGAVLGALRELAPAV